MFKLLKITISLLVAILLLGMIASVLFVTLVNPNRFKPMITEQVQKYTGRQLTIDGDLSWTFYPDLGVKVGHMELSNPTGFKQKTFAEIQSATVVVKLLPLLHAQIESTGIALKGMKLYLIKNANGKTNWQDLHGSSSTESKSQDATASKTLAKTTLGLAISGVDISNANIYWADEQAKQYFDIEKFELHSKDINLSKSFPIATSFNFAGKNPAVSGKITLASNISVNVMDQIAKINEIKLTANIQQGEKKFDAFITGNLIANLAEQRLQLNNLVGRIANLTVTGNVNVTDLLSKANTKGHVHVQPFDVKKWLEKTGQDVAALHQLNNVNGDLDFSMSGSKSLELTGNLQADDLQASKLKVTNIRIKTRMQNGVLQLSPMTADFYQGTMQGQTSVNFNGEVPKITLQAKVANVQAKPLFADIAGDEKIKMTGVGAIDLQISTQGKDGDAIAKNLNGTSQFSFNNGTIEGIDIGYLIENANALAHGKSSSRSNTDKTEFGSLTGTAVIRNGVMTNNDLYLNTPRFDVKGSGNINLVDQTINYKLNTSAKQAEDERNDLKNLYGLTIPITVVGNLNNPTIRLDAQSLMKLVAEQQLQKAKLKIQDKIKDKIKGKISEEAGELLGNLLGG